MFVSPQVNIIVNSFSELGLVSTPAPGPEVHLQPVLLQVVVKVAPSGLDVLEPGLLGVEVLAGVEPGQVLHLELPGVELLLVGERSEVRSVSELVGVEVDAGGPDLGVAHHHGEGLPDHLVLVQRLVHDPRPGEHLVRVHHLEAGGGDEVGQTELSIYNVCPITVQYLPGGRRR